MSTSNFGRRRFVAGTAGLGVAAFVARDAAAQRAGLLTRIAPDAAGSLHRAALEEIARALGDTPLSTREGLKKIVALLQRFELIDRSDAAMLDKLIDALFDAKTVDELQKRIEDLYRQLAGKAGDVAIAIASIARDSVAYAKTLLKKLGENRALAIVADDVAGAVAGATVGKSFGTQMAVLFAIGAGVYASARSAYGTK